MNPDGKRTAAGLRELLFEMIDGVKAGKVDDKTARTIATLAQSILNSMEVELQFRVLAASGKIIPSDIGELPLAALPAPKPYPERNKPESQLSGKTGQLNHDPVVPAGPRFVAGRVQSGGK